MSGGLSFARAFAAAVLVLLGAGTAARRAGLYWNATPSAPIGLWRVTSPEWQKGDMVLVHVPGERPVFREALSRRYLIPAYNAVGCAPLLKRVVASGGDRVEFGPDLHVNGRAVPCTMPLPRDRAGRELPVPPAGGIVPTGYIWVASERSRWSFDSRYFGAIPASGVLGRAEPIWTR